MKGPVAAALAALVHLAPVAMKAHSGRSANPGKVAVENKVRGYLPGNPEAIEAAIGFLRVRQREERRCRAKAAIPNEHEARTSSPQSMNLGRYAGTPLGCLYQS